MSLQIGLTIYFLSLYGTGIHLLVRHYRDCKPAAQHVAQPAGTAQYYYCEWPKVTVLDLFGAPMILLT